ncbi:MAG: proline--tRNA ligase [Filifactoraceae bacterium]
MKLSNIFLPTVKETPSDENKVERQLLIRAGMERKLNSGAMVRLPLGEMQLNHIDEKVRLALRDLIPQEISLFNVGKDDLDTDVVTDLIRNELKSYKQLPKTMRIGREEVKLYSFSNLEGKVQEEKQVQLIRNALKNLSIEYNFTVDNEFYGMGTGSEELIHCKSCGYTRRQGFAECFLDIGTDCLMGEVSKEHTPNVGTIDELMDFYNTDGYAFGKSLLIGVNDKVIMAMVPGVKDLSMKKLARHLGVKEEELGLVNDDLVRDITGAECGFAGPIGLKKDIEIYMDKRLSKRKNIYVGANETDYHFGNVNYDRDFKAELVDCLIEVYDGDSCPICKGKLEIVKGRLLARVMDMGTNYSSKHYVEYLDQSGKSQRARLTKAEIDQVAIMETIIAQNHDEKGIVYIGGQGVFDAIITIVNIKNEEQVNLGVKLEKMLREKGLSVLVDDRDERAGMKFADAELIGIKYQITVGKLAGEGKVEYCQRGKEKVTLELDALMEII